MILAIPHVGVPVTMPIGSWCLSLYISDGLLRVDPVYRCECGLIHSLWRCHYTVSDDGAVTPPYFCGSCRRSGTVRLVAWDSDPC